MKMVVGNSMVDKTNKLRRMGKRRFTKTLISLGVSYQAAHHMTAEKLESLTSDPTEEVPRLKKLHAPDGDKFDEPPYPDELEEREPVYYTIPRSKWIEVESAADASKKLEQRIENSLDGEEVRVSVVLPDSGDHDRYSLEATIVKREDLSQTDAQDLSDKLKEVLPEEARGRARNDDPSTEVDDIPIEHKIVREREDACDDESCDYQSDRPYLYNRRYRETNPVLEEMVMNGCMMTKKIDGDWDTDPSPTLGPRLHRNNHVYMTTSAHAVVDDDNGEDSSDAIGRSIAQPDPDYEIGEVAHAKFHRTDDDVGRPVDIALIELDDLFTTRSLAARDSFSSAGELSSDILGWDCIKDGEVDSICTQGIRSGRCSLSIYDFRENDKEIKLFRDEEDWGGNSGGPYFYDDDGELLVVGHHRASNSDMICFGSDCYEQHYSIGTHIEVLEDAMDAEVR